MTTTLLATTFSVECDVSCTWEAAIVTSEWFSTKRINYCGHISIATHYTTIH